MKTRFLRNIPVWLSIVVLVTVISALCIVYTRDFWQPGVLSTTGKQTGMPQGMHSTSIAVLPSKPTTQPTVEVSPQPTGTNTAVPQPTQPVPSNPGSRPQFSGLYVQGNQLLNAQKQPVVLHGVNHAGSEYACVQGWGFFDGPGNEASVQAMANWKINAVRVPLNENCWLNINGVPAQYAGENYKRAIRNFVMLLQKYTIYPILELHWSAPGNYLATHQAPMPDRDHTVTFWREVAASFKDQPNVLFDLYNEPHPYNNGDAENAWQCWRDGSTADPNSCMNTLYRDKQGNMVRYEVAGMQELVNAVREAGAQNVILLSGIQYANNISRWLEFKPMDPLSNLMAAWHVYPVGNICNDPECYNSWAAPIAAQVPLIASEVGEGVNGACGVTHTNVLFDWLDTHSASYLAWTWNTWGTSCGDLSLILDHNGTPKSPNGTNYRERLARLHG